MASAVMRIEPLNAQNYDTWKLQMKAILVKNDLWEYVGGALAAIGPREADWSKKDQKACADLMLSIAPSELGLISECETSKEIWQKLRDTFQSKGPARKAILLKRVALARMAEGENAREHLAKFFDAVSKLKEIGIEIGNDLLAILLLYSLPESFSTFRCAMETRDELPAPDILRVKILEEEESRSSKERDQNALYVKQKSSPQHSTVNGQNWRKKTKENCFKCGK